MPESRSVYDYEFCSLDIETTGTNPYSERIVEIGLVAFTIGEDIKKYETLINPEQHIPEYVTSIHGITDDMVKGSPVIADILQDIISFIGTKPLIIHNSRFDMSFLEMECRRAGVPVPAWISFDTVTLSRKVFPEMQNHKLDTLCREFKIDLSHHRALQDAAGCMQVFRKCIATADPVRSWNFQDLCTFQSKIERSGVIKELSSKERRGGKISIGKHSVIRYIDSEGTITERKILPKKIFKQGKQTVILAYCYLRNEDRVFKSNRIDKIIS